VLLSKGDKVGFDDNGKGLQRPVLIDICFASRLIDDMDKSD